LWSDSGFSTGNGIEGTELYEFVGGAWRLRRMVPACTHVIAMKEGLVLRLASDPNKAGAAPVPTAVLSTGPAPHVPPPPQTNDVVLLKPDDKDGSKAVKLGSLDPSQPLVCTWIGQRRVIYHDGIWSNSPAHMQELTADGFKNLTEGPPPLGYAIDMQAGQFVQAGQDGKIRLGGVVIPHYDRLYPTGGVVVRDKGGRIWRGLFRFDSDKPTNYGPRPLPFAGNVWQLGDPKVCQLDMTEGFKCPSPEAAFYWQGSFWFYDPPTRTGWRESQDSTAMYWSCIEVDKEGFARVVMKLSSKDDGLMACPRARAPDGSWWGTNNADPKPVFRVGSDGKVSKYSLPSSAQRSGAGIPHVSPKGAMFLAGGYNYTPAGLQQDYCKFNAAKGIFEESTDILDDYACKIGKYELAVLPAVNTPQYSSPVMQKVEGQWQQFRPAFAQNAAMASGACVHGDRMLLNFGSFGVVEYDAQNDRWARLTEDTPSSTAIIDAQGRRIIIGQNCALIYGGDPFESESWQSKKPSAKEEASFQSLLKQLDAAAYADRQSASKELGKLTPKFMMALENAAADKRLSIEVRERVFEILGSITAEAKAAALNAAMTAILQEDCPPPPRP
jgi:hypothetical protein